LKNRILIVDDEQNIRDVLKGFLEGKNYDVREASNASAVLEIIDGMRKGGWFPDLVLLDVLLPDMDGLALLQKLKMLSPGINVIVITGHGNVGQSVEAMRYGAFDYILKPFNVDEIVARIDKALETGKLKKKVDRLIGRMAEDWGASYIIGPNEFMKEIYGKIDRIARSGSTTVFIQGETGTGKEAIARRIHFLSDRRDGGFVAVNATALTPELMESELFGHEEGAFTGAVKSKEGLFEVASGGTLFLDEIGDMTLPIQSKILRVLQEKCIRRVGGTETIDVDIRLITATNKNLEEAVKEGYFRQDLYYRLNVVPLVIPPLRDRIDDIECFLRFFIDNFNREFGKSVKNIAPKALVACEEYLWPGNIRELRNLIERTMLLECDGDTLTLENLRNSSRKFLDIGISPSDVRPISVRGRRLGASIPLEQIEREHIEGVLRISNGNKNRAARILGIDRSTLYNKLKKYN